MDSRAAKTGGLEVLQGFCLSAARSAALLGVFVGVVVLTFGWGCNISIVRTVFSGCLAMRPNTALGLLLTGLALWFTVPGENSAGKRLTGYLCSGLAALLGLLTATEYVLNINLHIDELMFPVTATSIAPGPMSLFTAISLLLIGLALALSYRRRSFAIAQHLVIVVGALSTFNVIGYIYGIDRFFAFMSSAGTSAMALHTSLTFAVLCLGVLLSRPEWGYMPLITSQAPGGAMVRRLLPTALLIPIALGWLRWEGQKADLYDTAFGLALITSANIVVFTFLIWRSGNYLNGLDRDRCIAQQDLQQSEERHRSAESRYQTLLESIPQLVWTLSADGTCDYLSPQFIRYTGITEAAQNGVGWENYIHPEDLAPTGKLMAASAQNGVGFETEVRFRGTNGVYRWFRAVAAPVRDAAGTVIAWFGTSTDIDAIKATEAELRASADSFRHLADAMPQLVWASDPEGVGTFYNQRCYEYFGATRDQSMDLMWRSMLHPDDLRKCLNQREHAFKTGQPYAMEYRIMRASDRTWRWHLGRGAPACNAENEIIRWIGSSVDIEEYKLATASMVSLSEGLEERVCQRTAALAQANEQLAQTRAKLQSVLDAATQMSIIHTDVNGIIQMFSAGAEKMLQYQAGELEGKCTPECLHDPAECMESSVVLSGEFGRPIEGMRIFTELASQGKADQREWTYIRKDGSRLKVSLAITPVMNHEGVLTGFLGVAVDVTARKSLEHELRLNNQKLAEQTRRAEQANAAKGDFLAAMSHEIRTPMHAILGMADMLWESRLDAEQTQYVEVFRRAGATLLLLINDILDLSKIEAGHFELEAVDFDLEEVIDEAVDLMAVKARGKGIGFSSLLMPGTVTALVGDPHRLRRILINILGNAVKFTASGAVRLTIGNHASGLPGEIEFSVSDSGIGIPPDKLEAIFDDFTQADPSIAREYGGTGLGLGISRRMVESMSGSLTVCSVLGSGSTFRFNLLLEPSLGSSGDTFIAEDFSGQRVLVIDGNPANLLSLRETLSSWGCESDEFSHPREALAVLASAMSGERPYSLVLMSDRIHKAVGFEAADFEAAKALKELAPDLPTVMLGSGMQTEERRTRQRFGHARYTVQGGDPRELSSLVSAALKVQRNGLEGKRNKSEAKISSFECSDQKVPQILIVEDSPDNRLLVQIYMKGTQCRLTFAENGNEGVDRFAAHEFDLVLMDMQMPVMDGLTATRAIRAFERHTGATAVPIVALTANARSQDVELTREAGCNNHLSKPISKQKLLEVIRGYVPLLDGPPNQTVPTVIQTSIRVEMPEGLEEIVPGYLAARRTELLEITGLVATSAFRQIGVLAHNMKGTGSSYGMPELTRLGAALEHSAHVTDTDALNLQVAQLQQYLDKVQLFTVV